MTDDSPADGDGPRRGCPEADDFLDGDEFTQDLMHAIPDLVFVLDDDGSFLRWNDRLPAVSGYDPDEIADMHALAFVPDADELRIAAAIGDVLDTGGVAVRESALVTKDGDHVPYEFAGARVTDDDGDILGLIGTGRDISERKQRERTLRRQRDELETLNRINAVIRNVNQALVGAKTIDDITDLVCERLAASELYLGAVVAHVDDARNRLVVDDAAGIDEEFVRTVESAFEGRADESASAAAARTGEVQLVRKVTRNDDVPAELRAAADGNGFESVACIPLRYDATGYGVLVVHAAREDAFSPRESAVFGELGETIGHAINAIERKNALVADRVVELEFDVRESANFVVAASARTDATFELEGVVSKEGSTFLTYYSVDGGDEGAVLDLAEEATAVDHARFVAGDDTRLFEVIVDDPALLTTFAEYGVRVTSLTADDGTGRVAVEIPTGMDVRSLVDNVKETVPESELLAQRTADRAMQTTPELRTELREELTEKQRAVLRTAYFAGFFERPRRSSGEEVADAMDVAPSTFHQHLRVGLRKLLDTLMDNPHDHR
ncbi:bacterio-opsin activator domain-containing protein [Halobacteriaceae archaeon GCM10025711]